MHLFTDHWERECHGSRFLKEHCSLNLIGFQEQIISFIFNIFLRVFIAFYLKLHELKCKKVYFVNYFPINNYIFLFEICNIVIILLHILYLLEIGMMQLLAAFSVVDYLCCLHICLYKFNCLYLSI